MADTSLTGIDADTTRLPSGLHVPAHVVRGRLAAVDLTDSALVGRVASYYLLRDADWSRRHVETVEVLSERYAKRRLTVDIELPLAPEAAVHTNSEESTFVLPLALLAKFPLASHIDCVDEEGRTLALLNRDQNAEISFEAFSTAVEKMIGDLSPGYEDAIYSLTFGEPDEALYALHEFVAYAKEQSVLAELPCYRRLRGAADQLSANSILWIVLRGRPGDRRVVKLRYDIEIGPPRLAVRSRRPRRRTIETTLGLREVEFPPHEDPGPTSLLRRFWGRIATTFGWSSVDLYLQSPHLRDTDSYHLQVTAPPGLEMRTVELLADVRDDDDRPCPIHASDDEARLSAHAYIPSGLEVRENGPAVVTLRVGRRGFLSWSLLGCGVLSALLWFMSTIDIDFDNPQNGTEAQIAAAVLLIVPALLAAFIVRPGENLLARRLLSGVRLLLLTAGLTSAAGAAALAGVRPRGSEAQDVWLVCGAITAGVALLLAVSWVASLVYVWRAYRALRAWRGRLALTPLQWDVLATSTLGLHAALLVYLQHVELVGAAQWIAVAAAIAGLGAFEAPQASPGVASTLDTAALVIVPGVAVAVLDITPRIQAPTWTFIFGLVIWGITALGLVALVRSARKASPPRVQAQNGVSEA